jgi:hypothetical protein
VCGIATILGACADTDDGIDTAHGAIAPYPLLRPGTKR